MREALSLLLQRTQYLPSYKSSYQMFADVFKSCAATLSTNLGKSLHSHVIKLGHSSCCFIAKTLLNMYAKCRALEDCHKLFEKIRDHDTITWNILLSGFAGSRSHDHKVMALFNMFHAARDPKPSAISLAIVLPVCTRLGTQDTGKSMHAYAVKSGMESQTLV